MNGNAMIDAIGATIGMKSVTANTVPSRIQILALMNVAVQEAVIENPMAMHTLFVVLTAQDSADTHPTMVVPLSVQFGTLTLAGEYLPPDEYITYINSTETTDKYKYTVWAGSTILISETGDYIIMYVKQPSAYTDAAAEPTDKIPDHFSGNVIKKVMRMLLLAEGMPEGLQAIDQARGGQQ